MADVWERIATYAERIDRFDLATTAYRHLTRLRPSDPAPYLGAAEASLRLRRLDDARERARWALAFASDPDSRLAAHELLARIALTRGDRDAARAQAELARQTDPALPLLLYIDGRIMYDRGQYAEALPLLEQTIVELQKAGGLEVRDLHFYVGDILRRVERYSDAEMEFIEELQLFPHNTRARAGLAMLYWATGRSDAAARVVADLTRAAPTPSAYALATRLWKSFGNDQQASAVQVEARKMFAPR
jgi:tetratricopeptide (TPR) repeat protein